MPRIAFICFCVATIAPAFAADTPVGFTPLFNGKDLTGWHGWAIHETGASPAEMEKLSFGDRAKKIAMWTDDARKHWSVAGRELINDGNGAYLSTEKIYGDIELLIDYKTVAKADSGIYLRGTPQVQIWDSTEKAKFGIGADKGSGGLFNNSNAAPGKDAEMLADKPFGEWNHFRIIQIGARTTVYLNDKLVVDHARMENFWEKDRKVPLLKTGAILLQTHGGEIRWRNAFVREIPSAEANATLAKHASEGFQMVFNGKDFDGWAGDLSNHEIVEGAIVCKPKKGGVVFTKEQFDNFVVRLEFKTPPGGNNGLAIRHPGKGRASVDAMCEIQVLDDNDPRHKKLNPKQYNGSAYGLSASYRGYLRPTGEWNFEEVTVKGTTIQVELNGTQILDVDFTTLIGMKTSEPHPGMNRTSGHFGFCGHNDPVAFRNIAIKRLVGK